MTYVQLLKEHAAAEGILVLNSFGHGHLLFRGEWFGDQFCGNIDPETISEAFVEVITGPSEQIDTELY